MPGRRLSDLPEPYAVVVMLPSEPVDEKPITVTVNGKLARAIAWILDHQVTIAFMRGSIVINFGEDSFQAELHETFPRQKAHPTALPNPDAEHDAGLSSI